MMRPLAVVLVALAACGPTLTIYERTAPQRVEVTEQASPAELELSAAARGDAIELVAKRVSDVRITRTVRYGAIALDRVRGNPLIELLEVPIGLVLLAVPAMWETPVQFERSHTSTGVVRTNYIAALLSPASTALTHRIRTHVVDGTPFSDPPATRAIEVRLPASGVVFAYRVLDEGERELSAGTVTTDAFGRATLPSVDATTAVAIAVVVQGKSTVVPVDVLKTPTAR